MRPQLRNKLGKEKRLATSYLRLLIILDFWPFLVSGSYAPVVLMLRLQR
jgi:hypothetical protein